MSRRNALASLAAIFAGSPLVRGQQDPHGDLRGHKRIPGFDEMMSAFDFSQPPRAPDPLPQRTDCGGPKFPAN